MRITEPPVRDIFSKHQARLNLKGHGTVIFADNYKLGMGSWDLDAQQPQWFIKHGAIELTVAELKTEFFDSEEAFLERLNGLLTSL